MAGIAVGGGALAGERAGWNRFSQWPQWRARFGLLAFVLMLVAAVAVARSGGLEPKTVLPASQFAEHSARGVTDPERAGDLALYDRIVTRLQNGESYYDFIVEEQRLSGYPVTPGAAVRLPILAILIAATPPWVRSAAALLLLTAVALSWLHRLEREGIGRWPVRAAVILLLAGNMLLLDSFYHVLHEVWAGGLLALALGVHRPGRWGLSLAVTALALSIRELVLPFVLLMAAMAFWRRDWREGCAWAGLAAAFAMAYLVHLQMIAGQILPSDIPSASWLALGGLSGWLGKLVLSSQLHAIPPALAAPAVVCALAGWAGWRSAAGSFGTLMFLGYGLAFMIAGRSENFYWGLLVVPLLYIGFALAPSAILSLVRAAQLQNMFEGRLMVCKQYVLQRRNA